MRTRRVLNSAPNPYQAPESAPLDAQPITRRRPVLLVATFAFLASATIGGGIGVIATLVHWTLDEMNPLDRWPMFWAYLAIGAFVGGIVGALWSISLLLRRSKQRR